jgi:Protein of unknown function (DUF3562)
MNDQATNSQESGGREIDIESLAREIGVAVETVHAVYDIERAELDRIARIKLYVPVLARRHVKTLLGSRRRGS